jgi:L-fucose mutarotase
VIACPDRPVPRLGKGLTPVLKFPLLHPQILEALGRAGHGAQILIADGNYPFSTTLGANAVLVSLNLRPGLVNATQVLETIVSAVPIEAAAVMAYARQGPYGLASDPPVWAEFRDILAGGGFREPLQQIERFDFYRATAEDRVALVIATAEQRIYANILLTLGVVMPR